MIVITRDIKRYTMTSQLYHSGAGNIHITPAILQHLTKNLQRFHLIVHYQFIRADVASLIHNLQAIYKNNNMSDNILLVTYALSLSNNEQPDHIVKQ